MDTVGHYRIDLPGAVAGGTIPVTLGCDARFVADRIAVRDGQRFAVPFSPASDAAYLSVEVTAFRHRKDRALSTASWGFVSHNCAEPA